MKKWGLYLEDSLIKEYEATDYSQALKDLMHVHTVMGELYQLKHIEE